jgi:peptide/nickel transport system permease protein
MSLAASAAPVRQFLRRRGSAAMLGGGLMLAAWTLIALAAPLLAPHDPFAQDISRALLPPGAAHPMGTDNFGRDVLSRVIWGARIDLTMGIAGVLAPFVIGCLVGLVAGYVGGVVDTVLMRILDVALAFPFLVLVIAIVAVLGPGLGSFLLSLALVGWVSYARILRKETQVLKHADFIQAVRGVGFGAPRILLRHILPNAISPALVFAMSDVVLTILLGSSLSYLGLGVAPPTAEWGLMIAEGQNFIATAWWICLFPGLAIVVLAFGFSLIADGLAARLGLKE